MSEGRIVSIEVEEHKLGDHRLSYEESAAFEMCRTYCPEAPEKLWEWFKRRPESFTFGPGQAGSRFGFDVLPRPTPIFVRDGAILEVSLGVEVGRQKYTGLRMYERRRFTIDLLEILKM